MTVHPGPVVRVAPSPTGDPHVGTAYIALFNYAYARKHGGRFILRIEDTDQTRYAASSEAQIFQALRWLGLTWDEGPDVGGPLGPYRQSERKTIYGQYAEQLVTAGRAYRCFCTAERLDEMRKRQEAAKQPTGYDRHCRYLPADEVERRMVAGDPHVIRLAVPLEGETVFEDLVRGMVRFENAKLDDLVLLKSDGYPTYHLAVVVDDHLMGVTLVARAEDWISSTPKHMLIYAGFGWIPPQWVHMPLLRNADKSKISKRKNPTSLIWYREQGFLPKALLNFLALQGWSMPDGREIFTLNEFVEAFTWERVVTSGPIFDITRLDALNGHYIRQLDPGDLFQALDPFLPEDARADQEYTMRIIPLIYERLHRLSDFIVLTRFFFEPDHDRVVADPALLTPKRLDAASSHRLLEATTRCVTSLSTWTAPELEQALRTLADNQAIRPGDLFMVIRVAVTGSTATPPLFDTMQVLGRERVIPRLEAAARLLHTHALYP